MVGRSYQGRLSTHVQVRTWVQACVRVCREQASISKSSLHTRVELYTHTYSLHSGISTGISTGTVQSIHSFHFSYPAPPLNVNQKMKRLSRLHLKNPSKRNDFWLCTCTQVQKAEHKKKREEEERQEAVHFLLWPSLFCEYGVGEICSFIIGLLKPDVELTNAKRYSTLFFEVLEKFHGTINECFRPKTRHEFIQSSKYHSGN